ncbi:Uncharacterised protein [Sphingobacterium spiritivorum]|nr:Uncharacterised protein [Sphingobacterium spiritivorum]
MENTNYLSLQVGVIKELQNQNQGNKKRFSNGESENLYNQL